MSEGGWIRVCRADEIRSDEGKQVTVEGTAIGLYRLEDGCYALNDVCTHAFAHLSTGFVEDGTVECPLHQARFEIRTGKALDDIAPTDVASYAVKVEEGEVYVKLAPSAEAEEAQADADPAAEDALALLQQDGDAAAWTAVLADGAEFEVLHQALSGREAVAERLGGTRTGHLEWSRLARPGIVLTGEPKPGTGDRGMALTLHTDGGKIVRVQQQNLAMPPRPGTPVAMGAALRQRIDEALAGNRPILLSYVDAQGKPHVSFRGSLRSYGEDKLSLWARQADRGLAAAIEVNPNVAMMYRDGEQRATYQLAGRAYVIEDEDARRAIFEAMPKVERDHDYAMLGAAIVIELDLIEGWAGIGPSGPIDPVRMVRE